MSPCLSGATNNPTGFLYPVETLLPKSGQMVLIDEVVEAGDDFIVVALTVRDDGLFSDADHHVPAWLGLEYMAQAVAAYSGYRRTLKGQEIELGFLLGTRFYECSAGRFDCGERLTIRAQKIIEAANDMAVFDCSLSGANVQAASKLNLLMPQDSKKFLAGKGI
jgi:predicted hotdog family 3-hydroxylacyl-ACP dehydratase